MPTLPDPSPLLAPEGVTAARHVPERTCVACRRKRPQNELLRLSRVEGEWTLSERPYTGRGSYLCADSPACWQEKKLRRSCGAQAPRVAALLAAQTLPQGADPSSESE